MNKPMQNVATVMNEIEELEFQQVLDIGAEIDYYDGLIAFADNVRSIPSLHKVLKVDFFVFIYCVKGSLSLSFDGREISVGEGEAVVVSAQTVVSGVAHSDDFECKLCAVPAAIEFGFVNKVVLEALMHMRVNPVLRFDNEERAILAKYYELAMLKIKHPQLIKVKMSFEHLFRALVLDVFNKLTSQLEPEDSEYMRQGDRLFRNFILQLSVNADNKRSVKDFAELLCVSPKYLTSVCRRQSGKTASELIMMSCVSRIRQQLIYSDKSVKEIATELNFDNLSFFGKYVKKHLGASPNNYRKQNRYGY